MLSAPGWMRRNAQRGLDWNAAGYGGDGLTDKTLREARAMAAGDVSEDKAARMAAWFARHMADLQGTDKSTEPPTPGMVAHALWGGWPIKESRRAQTWAESQKKGDTMRDTIERRSASCAWEIREAADGVVGLRGYAAVFDSEAHGEVVRRSAFNKTLADGADVRFLINHEGLPLARTKSGTMTLRADEVGLLMDVPALDMSSPQVQSLVSAIRRGDLDQMSFAFMTVRDNFTAEGVRELNEVKLVDVSAVTYPWYEATSVGMKSDETVLVEARAAESEPVAEPMMFGTDADSLSDSLQAADAALDAAQTLLGQYRDSDPVIAQAYELICAADAALDEVQEALGLSDPDDDANEASPADLAPDEPRDIEDDSTSRSMPNRRALALDDLRRMISRA